MSDIKKKNDFLGRFIAKMKANKKLELGVYALLIGGAVILYISTFSGGAKKTAEQTEGALTKADISAYEMETENRLKRILSCIDGAGDVEVMITFESGTQIVPAMDTDSQSVFSQNGQDTTDNQSESSSPATISKSGENEPIVLMELQPSIRGVIVIAQGASDIKVKMDLLQAVQTVLGVEAGCIDVFSMTSAGNK